LKWLKRIRIAVAVILIFSVSLIFFDVGKNLPLWMHTVLVSLQVVPSLLRTVVLLSAASTGLFFIILATLIYGRIYCSAICPLGILQDLVIRVARRIDRRRRYKFKKPQYILHYSILAFTLTSAIFGSVILLNIFEPFSIYGRIISNLASPLFSLLNNLLVYIFSVLGFVLLFQIPILNLNIVSVVISFLFLVLIVYLSYSHGRLFCNLLCPAGALLGLISRLSVFKIVIDDNNCKDCGLCERVCKANCIESNSKKIDFAACVGCFNCLDGCPTGGMRYEIRWLKQAKDNIKVDDGRRNVLKTSILPVFGFFIQDRNRGGGTGSQKIGYEDNREYPISPPGSIDVRRFSNLCTACHMCVSSCPTQVLLPSIFEYGIAGIFQPKMNYDASYCNFDCVICGQVCPTGAILPLEIESKKLVQIGKACFVKDDCVVVKDQTDCGACSEHCPTKAVSMVPYGRLVIPEVNDDLCIGCGACEHACPASPQKAIYVISNPVHLTAQRPHSKKIEKSFDSAGDFPF
jgi:ferredoxin